MVQHKICQRTKDLSTDFENTETPLRQVIMNTHSPILVGKILEMYMKDKNASVLLSAMINSVVTINEKRIGLYTTKMENPFSDYTDANGIGTFEEKAHEGKLKHARTKIKKYLETSDFENLKSTLSWQEN